MANFYDGDDVKVKGDDGSDDGAQITVTADGSKKRLDTRSVVTFLSDSANASLDAFSRLRVSNPEVIYDASFRWDKQPVTWAESVTSGGTVTHVADAVSVSLACTTTTGSAAIFQSRNYSVYPPGVSQLILLTGNLNGSATNVTKRLGYFDESNGYFFQLASSTLSVAIRSKVSGSVVDTAVAQASWNIDKLDGSGASGVTLDTSKQLIFIIDFQWLGSGRVRFGFVIGGKILYCHESLHSNVITVPYSQTGNAPIRAEITNAGATAASIHLTCVSVLSESSWAPEGILRSINNGSTSRSFGTSETIPVISLRKKTAFVNVPVRITNMTTLADTADDFLIQIIFNGTLTGASWTDVSGACQRDVAGTAISGGTVVYSTYKRGGGDAIGEINQIFRRANNTVLGRDVAGTSDIISLVATNITTNAKLYGTINYEEML